MQLLPTFLNPEHRLIWKTAAFSMAKLYGMQPGSLHVLLIGFVSKSFDMKSANSTQKGWGSSRPVSSGPHCVLDVGV